MADRDVIELTRGSSYGQSYGVPADDFVTIKSSGSGDPAVIYGDEEVDESEWTPSAHGDADGVVYELDWTTDAVTGELGTLRMWEDDVQIDDEGSVADCAANPGSFYCPDSRGNGGSLWTGGSALVYYHPTGSGDPTSNGKVTRIIARINGIHLGDNANVSGVEVRRCAANDGPLILGRNSYVDRCIVDGDSKHGCVVGSGAIRNTTFLPGFRYTYPSEIGNGVLGWYTPAPNGLSTLIDRCFLFGAWDSSGTVDSVPVTQHGESGGYSLSRIKGSAFLYFLAVQPSANRVEYDGVYLKGCTQSVPTGSYTESLTVNEAIVDNRNSDVTKASTSITGTATFNDCCFYMVGDSTQPLVLVPNAANITFNNCIFFNDINVDAVDSRSVVYGSGSAARTVTFNNCLFTAASFWGYMAAGTNLVYAGSRNLFIRYGHTSTDIGGMSATTNLAVSTSSGHGYTSNGQVLALIDSIFNGDSENVADGDFRILQSAIQAINSGSFPDGASISDHWVGPRTYWDFASHRSTSGQPSAWPLIPTDADEARGWFEPSVDGQSSSRSPGLGLQL